ncbi:hypothetical protein [Oscillatoria sp. FACHB-1406]|nr:hypothetical protein [Oscillatoria sp. FACHB-1406]MBD2576367.1 hypothetical protein [Oscillatoria sp. FACHB-1406]
MSVGNNRDRVTRRFLSLSTAIANFLGFLPGILLGGDKPLTVVIRK